MRCPGWSSPATARTPWAGCATTWWRATWPSSRTTSPTTTLEHPVVSQPALPCHRSPSLTDQQPIAVAFGGPSPEHDVSILTGLQAARELASAGREVISLYWAKTSDWFRLPPALEAADFLQGIPRGAEELRLVLGEEPGFAVSGRMGRSRRLEIAAVVNCCHGGPGEDASLQGAFDLASIAYTG